MKLLKAVWRLSTKLTYNCLKAIEKLKSTKNNEVKILNDRFILSSIKMT